MGDDDKVKEGTSSRGNEWEVVTLTASTYAAEPGPKDIGSTDGSKDKELAVNELEFTRSMFMSGHFVFPPSEHENLPLEPNSYEVQSEVEAKVQQLHFSEHGAGGPDKNQEEIWSLKGLSDTSELHQVELLEKGKKLSAHGMTIEETKEFHGVILVKEEQDIYTDPGFSSFHSSAGTTEHVVYEDRIGDEDPDDPSSLQNLDAPSDSSKPLNPTKDIKSYRFPSETWWKTQAASLYAQAKEANTFWSIFVAAALMGIVILGHRWQQERWQIQQLKWKLNNNDMSKHRVLGPLNRFKDVFVGASQRGLGGIYSAKH